MGGLCVCTLELQQQSSMRDVGQQRHMILSRVCLDCMYSWVALSESRRAPPVSLRSFIYNLPETLKAAAARKNPQQQEGRGSVVFVISASPSIDSVLVPQWGQPHTKTEPGAAASVSGPPETSPDCQQAPEQHQPQRLMLAVAPHSYQLPASLRCDRLLHELGRLSRCCSA